MSPPPPRRPKKNSKPHLPSWTNSLSHIGPLSLLVGGTEGGFLSLEEIDDVDYGPIEESETLDMSRKRKGNSEDGNKKKKRKKKKKKVVVGEVEAVEGDRKRNEGNESDKEDPGADREWEDDYRAWNELRLHPLLMQSIRRLGFKEPTRIQKACIPVAAHQGKDVIGAAETGSGKTLAFGLPILQRLLDEKEKTSRLSEEGKTSEPTENGSPLRALIITPTRELALQVTDHLKEAAKFTSFRIVPIVGGIYTEKQERLLKKRPEIVVGTPGRLWELMSGGNQHLTELHSVSFFVLDEADRMIENGHFHELQSIIDMLPLGGRSTVEVSENFDTVPNAQLKKRQTCVFSATIALSDNFRKKLKRGFSKPKTAMTDGLTSIEMLSERAGMKPDVAIVDLTNSSIVAEKLEESFIECTEENKDTYLYYILSVHGQGQTIVFCTSIAALRRMSSLLHILGVNAWTLHAQMQQRARLKAIDRFRTCKNGILVATDVAARGLDIPGVRTVVHYQLPHSAEVYIHRSGRTARASLDGCSIALISPLDRMKFYSLCKSLSKDNLLRFPVEDSYMFEISKRMSLARQIDKSLRKTSQKNVKKSWIARNAEAIDLVLEKSDSEEDVVQKCKQKKVNSVHLQKLQQELKSLLARPLQPKQFSRKFLAGAGLSSILQKQLEELSKMNQGSAILADGSKPKLVVIGQDLIEPLQALRTSGREVSMNTDKSKETRKLVENWKKKKQAAKKHERDERRKKKKDGKLARR